MGVLDQLWMDRSCWGLGRMGSEIGPAAAWISDLERESEGEAKRPKALCGAGGRGGGCILEGARKGGDWAENRIMTGWKLLEEDPESIAP